MNKRNVRRRGKSSRSATAPRRSSSGADRPKNATHGDPGQDSEDMQESPSGARRPAKNRASKLRIIGGALRGRSVKYHGDAYTRPMKDSVRENLFNILGPAVKSSLVFDLFGGTAALSFEAVSRGAARVTVVEQSKHAIRYIRESAEHLGVTDQLMIVTGDAFRVAGKLLQPPTDDRPWMVLLCPPYRMWEDEKTLVGLSNIIHMANNHAPPGSVIVVETEKRFDPEKLPKGDWDFRVYGGTRLGFLEPAMACGLQTEDRCGDLF